MSGQRQEPHGESSASNPIDAIEAALDAFRGGRGGPGGPGGRSAGPGGPGVPWGERGAAANGGPHQAAPQTGPGRRPDRHEYNARGIHDRDAHDAHDHDAAHGSGSPGDHHAFGAPDDHHALGAHGGLGPRGGSGRHAGFGPRGFGRPGGFGLGPVGGRAAVRLVAVLAADGPESISQLADAIGVDQPRASRLAQAAIAAGHVRREVDPGDARRSILTVTDAGRAMLSAAVSHRRSAIETALAGFTESERVEFARLFARFVEAWPHHR
ncbi:MarR family winged helix-turn-helix transcriptional regulator [Agromyces aerolatus]|uniref:MarR family winged helix-turn-helix transcriptional regulator n=1 Tax=Agromyces sp. LY-1074 TaxID=3074080 RepID=UPI0028545C18|nr:MULTISPECIES: MarR family winged helix-turn-helix transcriptional regulator [unclassified Agromyces]MDR5700976.1 MarR family winged helix-turn-helix transcriptional regulator [Agromyces sp. LY-1074]MDR5707363.1 MarR family winged helix-turn-helix transcriptional regulator [Agromyces sp. LY-1358]